jgi:hypothetical protein
MKLGGTAETVDVIGKADLLEANPSAHTDIDQTVVEKLPLEAVGGLNQAITLASPGVVADSNGFFHPIGDHAQTQFSIDNQPITDQQSRIYSNQISPEAVQSMEVITGVPPAEYGDKSSLIVHVVTKSGLDAPKPTGRHQWRLRIVQDGPGGRERRRGIAQRGRFRVLHGPPHRSVPRSSGVRCAA